MTKKKFNNPVIHFYSNVGTPHLVFFIALFLLLIAPIISIGKYSLLHAIFDSFYIGSIYYLAKSFNPRRLNIIGFIVLISIIEVWLSYFEFNLDSFIDHVIPLILLILSFYYVFKSILLADEVVLDTILSAASGYMLIGFAFGILFYIMEVMTPGSFTGGQELLSFYNARYLSFVTMSTLGYGDILPISDAAKSLVIITTLFGQFYMAIIVGIIVGKFISSRGKKGIDA